MNELFAIMEKLPDFMLENIQRAEKWAAGDDQPRRSGEAGCLLYHAAGLDPSGCVDYSAVRLHTGIDPADFYERFDAESRHRGASVVGRECSARAAEILAARRAAAREAVDA